MEITAKVLQVLPLETGVNAKGEPWKKLIVVFDQGGSFPKKLAVELWKDQADKTFKVGETYNLKVDVESREYQGKWYTGAKCWGATLVTTEVPQPTQQRPQEQQPQQKYESVGAARQAATNNVAVDPNSDLPF